MSDVTGTIQSLRAAARAGRPVALSAESLTALAMWLERAEERSAEAAVVAAAQDATFAAALRARRHRADAARDRRACWWLVAAQAVFFAATVANWMWGW